jgi:hypothetical protein
MAPGFSEGLRTVTSYIPLTASTGEDRFITEDGRVWRTVHEGWIPGTGNVVGERYSNRIYER